MLQPVVVVLGVSIALSYQGNHFVTNRDSDGTSRHVPGFAAETRGARHACGLTSAGRALCWGANYFGQLGSDDESGRPVHRDRPVAVATAERFRAISAGAEHTCALTRTGVVYCWGLNRTAELGQAIVAGECDAGGARRVSEVSPSGGAQPAPTGPDVVFPCSRRPVRIETRVRFDAISAGFGHTCALSDGRAFCWGRNDRGQLGAARSDDVCDGIACSVFPVPVSGAPRFSSIAAGGTHTCGLANGVAYCWGSNQYGQLGLQAGDGSNARPTPIATSERVVAIDAGGTYTCIATAGGKRQCWGMLPP